jgi:hypothetical protein
MIAIRDVGRRRDEFSERSGKRSEYMSEDGREARRKAEWNPIVKLVLASRPQTMYEGTLRQSAAGRASSFFLTSGAALESGASSRNFS